MGLKQHSYTRYFLYFITISLLSSLTTFAQAPKAQAKKPAQSKSDAQVKTLNTFNSTVAYKIWDDWYKLQEQGVQLPEPTLAIRAKDDKEFNEISRTWNKAAEKAKLAAQKRREDARNGKTSFQAQSVFPLLNSDSMSVAQPIPTTNALTPFNQPPKGIAGLSSFRMGPQPAIQSQPMPNNNAVVMAQNNRSIAETNAKNISYNVAKAKELANIAFASTDAPGVTTKYHIDNNNPTGLPQVVEELQNDQVVRQYTYGADGIISMRQLINNQWVVSFFIKDGQGSVRMLTDVNGNVTDTYDYDAYGNLINKTGNTPNTRLYNGEEYDPDLGFYYLRARFLDTVKGRFLTQDTYETSLYSTIDRHKYNYASNNPVNITDPSGHFGIAEAAAGFSFINTIANISPANLEQTVSTVQNSSLIETLKLNIIYEDTKQNGTRFQYSDMEKLNIRSSFVYFAGYGFGNIDIKFNITETDGDATNLFDMSRMINNGYVPGSLNAFFTKRGDPSDAPAVTINNGSFINSKSDPKNLLHELIHQIGFKTNFNGYKYKIATEIDTRAIEINLLEGRPDYNLPPLDKNLYYKVRLWGAEYAAQPNSYMGR